MRSIDETSELAPLIGAAATPRPLERCVEQRSLNSTVPERVTTELLTGGLDGLRPVKDDNAAPVALVTPSPADISQFNSSTDFGGPHALPARPAAHVVAASAVAARQLTAVPLNTSMYRRTDLLMNRQVPGGRVGPPC